MPYKALLDYLPAYWDHVVDINVLFHAVEPEIEALIKACQDVRDDQFIVSMSLSRILAYEKMFGLSPDGLSHTLRKKRILSTVSRQTPFSLPFLIHYLNQFLGLGRWYHYFFLDIDTYRLFMDYRLKDQMIYVQKMIDTIMPAHILLEYELYMPHEGVIHLAIQSIQKTTITYSIPI